MKFIDKDAHLQAGRDITDQYLETTCKVDDGGGMFNVYTRQNTEKP